MTHLQYIQWILNDRHAAMTCWSGHGCQDLDFPIMWSGKCLFPDHLVFKPIDPRAGYRINSSWFWGQIP